ncbi:MAG TPA: hypothetical protein VHD38_02990 [Candidatus Paceibacterota bacterium]|nr:hypothetical protein [Candidatus Paceibacterota bacterium]
MKRQLSRPVVWTNFFYVIPLLVAFSYGLTWTALSIAALFIFSIGFHTSNERKFVFADICAAGIVAMFCAALLLSGAGIFSGYGLIAALLLISAVYIRFGLENGKRSGPVHGLWHIVAATLILTCLLSAI